MRLRLLVLTSARWKGKAIHVNGFPFQIGRDPDCQLRPASLLASKRHCSLYTNGNEVFVRDPGSANGTYVNDQRVLGERELRNGDRLRVGPLLFGVCLKTDTSATPTTVQSGAEAITTEETFVAWLLSSPEAPAPHLVEKTQGLAEDTISEIQLSPDCACASRPVRNDQITPADTSLAAKKLLGKYMRRTLG